MQEEVLIDKKIKLFILLKLVLFAVLYFVVQLLSSLLIAFIFKQFQLDLEQKITLPIVSVIFGQAVFLVVYIKIFNRIAFNQAEPEKKESKKNSWIFSFLKGIFFGIAIMTMVILIRGLFATVLEFGFYNIKAAIFLIFGNLIITFSAAVLEEYIFRFTLYGCLKKILNSNIWAIALVSILFSCLHIKDGVGVIDLLFYFMFSIFLCLIVDKIKSLWWAVGFHTGWNYIADGGNIFKVIYKQETAMQIFTLKIILLAGIVVAITGLYIFEKMVSGGKEKGWGLK